MSTQPKRGATKRVTSLETLVQYTIARNPKAVMRLAYESGALPYAGKEPVQNYLLRESIALVRENGEDGIAKFLSVHPDKDLILELFGNPIPAQAQPKAVELAEVSSNYTGPAYPLGYLPTPVEKETDRLAVIGFIVLFITIIYIIQ